VIRNLLEKELAVLIEKGRRSDQQKKNKAPKKVVHFPAGETYEEKGGNSGKRDG